jgi:AcrR family transcriptional regulator
VTVSPREQMPAARGRRAQPAAMDTAARAAVARNRILATTILDIAGEAGKSTASFYNCHGSTEWTVRERHEETGPT